MNEMMSHGSKSKDRPWTKQELTLLPGPINLAKAIIRQYILDGKPKSDEQAIKYWQSIIDQYEK